MRMGRKQKGKIRNRAEAFAGGEEVSHQVENPTELPTEFNDEGGEIPPAPISNEIWGWFEFGLSEEEARHLAGMLRDEVERGEYRPRIEFARRLLSDLGLEVALNV